MDQPEVIFEPYGPAVITEVRRHLRRSGTLGPLLRQLNLPAPRSLTEQYQILAGYVEAQGAVEFLNQVSLTDPANTVFRRRGRVTAAELPDVRFPGPKDQAPSPSPAPPQGLSQPIQHPGAPPVPGPPAAAVPPSPSPVAPDGMIRTANYVGPDRRSGEERRKGPRDRREGLETVYRNRRFGGWDRRKTVRREEDRLKAAREPGKK